MAVLAPFMQKFSYYLPTSNNQAKNVANIRYITRAEAVDYGEIEPEDSEKVGIAKNEFEQEQVIHAKYMHERPRSSGLFGMDDSDLDVEKVKDTLSKHSGVVWRVIVSLREDEAIRINHLDRSDWQESLRGSFTEIQEKLGMSESNFRWVAAYHPEPGHPHCHVLFWEETPLRSQGKLSPGELKDIKRAFVKNIYSKERERLLIQKTFYRDALREGARDVLGIRNSIAREKVYIGAEIGGRPTLNPRLDGEQEKYLIERLESLSRILPGQGRVALKYMPDNIKTVARELADWVLSQPGFEQEKELYLQAHLEITRMYISDRPVKTNQAMIRTYEDLRDRIAQDILKAAVSIQRIEKESQYRDQVSKNQIINSFWKGAWISIQREKSKSEYQARILKAQLEREEKLKEGRQR
ncbi:Uncharacterized [Syntrophomonas zehnderi OL-4]|uniref:Uncharacterized n=1 Tax=Syntrophomonas zehnderi OL-4 TaxID=690567 RepID=A0A0E4C7X4_9FIRM|nr:MobP3 family relaxase [Syntrophomonas zehnderi]CFX16461.1 Uncharacterized [Syntrophomonas zehnderi OL-4]